MKWKGKLNHYGIFKVSNKYSVLCLHLNDLHFTDFDGQDFNSEGSFFNDSEAWELSGKANITEIMIVCKSGFLRAIQIKYGDFRASAAGEPSWDIRKVFYLGLVQDEFVVAAVTESGPDIRLNDLKIITNKRSFGPCGPFPRSGGRLMEHRGSQSFFISGYAGVWLNTLVFHWTWIYIASKGSQVRHI